MQNTVSSLHVLCDILRLRPAPFIAAHLLTRLLAHCALTTGVPPPQQWLWTMQHPIDQEPSLQMHLDPSSNRHKDLRIHFVSLGPSGDV